jgi:hypothetical protein
MQHCADGNSDNFRVRDFYANIFFVSARLEKVVNKTVYCKSAIAHIKSSPCEFLSANKILGGDFSFFKYQCHNCQLGLFREILKVE